MEIELGFQSVCENSIPRAVPAGLSLGARTLAPEVRLSDHLSRTSRREEMTSPYMSRKAYLSGLSRLVIKTFTARLNPCPSCRDAFSLSLFSACAPDEHFVQNAP
jgi:hypothetical protein